MESRSYEQLQVDFRPINNTSGFGALITLNNPPRNAMSEAMSHSFAQACADLKGDEKIRTVTVTGAPPVFSAGGDFQMLESLASGTPAANAAFMREFYRRFLGIREIGVPTIAAINGHAIGAGFCIACACDFRLAVGEAKLGFNFLRIGLHPGMGATYFAPKVFGPAVGGRLLLSGDIFTATHAVAQGGDIELVEKANWDDRLDGLIQHLGSTAPGATRRMLSGLRRRETAALEQCLATESTAQALDYAGQEFLGAIKAMQAKETPRFD